MQWRVDIKQFAAKRDRGMMDSPARQKKEVRSFSFSMRPAEAARGMQLIKLSRKYRVLF